MKVQNLFVVFLCKMWSLPMTEWVNYMYEHEIKGLVIAECNNIVLVLVGLLVKISYGICIWGMINAVMAVGKVQMRAIIY